MIDTKELLKLAGQSFDPYFTFILLRKRGQFQSKKIVRLVKFYAELRRESIVRHNYSFS